MIAAADRNTRSNDQRSRYLFWSRPGPAAAAARSRPRAPPGAASAPVRHGDGRGGAGAHSSGDARSPTKTLRRRRSAGREFLPLFRADISGRSPCDIVPRLLHCQRQAL